MLEWVKRDSLNERLTGPVKLVSSLMDSGRGLRPQTIIATPRVLVCVEANDESVVELRRRELAVGRIERWSARSSRLWWSVGWNWEATRRAEDEQPERAES